MVRAIEHDFEYVLCQCCQVHFAQPPELHSRSRKAAVLAQLKTVTEAPKLTAARKAVGEAAEALGRSTPKVAVLLDNYAEEILAVS